MAPGADSEPEEVSEQPLELILARNLISIISIAALLVDSEGAIVFFNDAAAEIVGAPFEEIGVLERDEWSARYGPFDERRRPACTRRAAADDRATRGAPRLRALTASRADSGCSRSRPARCR